MQTLFNACHDWQLRRLNLLVIRYNQAPWYHKLVIGFLTQASNVALAGPIVTTMERMHETYYHGTGRDDYDRMLERQ
jgi:hypothetical protein